MSEALLTRLHDSQLQFIRWYHVNDLPLRSVKEKMDVLSRDLDGEYDFVAT